MTWVFIIAYDLWNFCYTYNCLPTHSWYCGIALLLAPTIAGLHLEQGRLDPEPRVHPGHVVHVLPDGPHVRQRLHLRCELGEQPQREPGRVAGGPRCQHRRRLAYIVYRSKKLGVNPYKQEVFVGTKDFKEAMARRADTAYLLETEPKSATPAEIAEMVAYNAHPRGRHRGLRVRGQGRRGHRGGS